MGETVVDECGDNEFVHERSVRGEGNITRLGVYGVGAAGWADIVANWSGAREVIYDAAILDVCFGV